MGFESWAPNATGGEKVNKASTGTRTQGLWCTMPSFLCKVFWDFKFQKQRELHREHL